MFHKDGYDWDCFCIVSHCHQMLVLFSNISSLRSSNFTTFTPLLYNYRVVITVVMTLKCFTTIQQLILHFGSLLHVHKAKLCLWILSEDKPTGLVTVAHRG